MTTNQAYKVIGVAQGSSGSQVEQAYKNKLQSLHLQMIPGQPLAVRERADQQVAELASAWDRLKNLPSRTYSSTATSSRKPSQQQTAASFTQQPRHARSIAGFCWPALSNQALAASFLIAAFMMLLVILLCVNAFASWPVGKAPLRVFSVPWCHVEIDGKPLGPSGQAKAFRLKDGTYNLTFRRQNKVLTKSIEVHKGYQTIIKVQFEKGKIHVNQI